MKSTADKRLQTLSFVYRGLIIFLAFLGAVFIGGTIYGVALRPISPKNEQVDVLQKSGEKNEGGQTFTGIGRIRVSTMDPDPGMVIIFVSFVYYPEDKSFSEELALRIGDFRNIIADYFGSFTIVELRELSEEHIKTELLSRFNAILRLGQLETLYFGDYMVVG